MKQVLLVAAIYSLVLYQSQKNAKDKIVSSAQRSIAKAASLPLKLYQQSLQLRHASNQKKESTFDPVFALLTQVY